MRVVICGSPRAGKTTRAQQLGETTGAPVRHTDDLIGLPHGEDSAAVARWFSDKGPWIVEGVTAARALRTWLEQNPSGRPCDEVVLMRFPVIKLTPGQEAMAKGCETVWRQIAPRLAQRGVSVVMGRASALGTPQS